LVLLFLSVIVGDVSAATTVSVFFFSCVLRFICFRIFERSFEETGFLRRCRVRFVTISSLPLESSDDDDER